MEGIIVLSSTQSMLGSLPQLENAEIHLDGRLSPSDIEDLLKEHFKDFLSVSSSFSQDSRRGDHDFLQTTRHTKLATPSCTPIPTSGSGRRRRCPIRNLSRQRLCGRLYKNIRIPFTSPYTTMLRS